MILHFLFFIFPFIYCIKTDRVSDVNNQRNWIEQACDSIPTLNQDIVDFVKTKIKKKVGRGECWDLAAEALWSVEAKWDGRYAFGTKVDYKSECVFAGDIIQFENVKVVYKHDNGESMDVFPHHTAIIYEVKAKGQFVLAHQNTGYTGKKVGLSPLELANVVKGKYTI